MFGLGGWEILVILCVALVVIKPEDLPDILRSCGKAFRKLKNMSREFTSVLDDVSHEVGDIKTIIGDDGKSYKAYDVDAKESKND